MWIVIGFHSGDLEQAKALLGWLQQLDGKTTHGCLLCPDPAVEWGEVHDLIGVANQTFQRVEVFSPDVSVGSWPAGANFLFKGAAQYLQSRHVGPWFWCEPDCIPLKKYWMDALESAYKEAKKPFLGTIMTAREIDLPLKYLPGCAVYPWNAWGLMEKAWDETKAFDMATAPATVPLAADTDLIHHFWGPSRDLPPTFVEKIQPDSSVNAWTLHNINPKAVVFHRNKDLSLIRLLGYHGGLASELIDVVFPFCVNDSALMRKNISWLGFLHGKKPSRAILLEDASTPRAVASEIGFATRAAFDRVMVHRYVSSGHSGWPAGPNRAFREACSFMANQDTRGWLWYEADAVALKPDWLERLSREYFKSGKPFMGTIIDHMGHINGGAIYPKDVHRYAPSLMTCSIAWDVGIGSEIVPYRHRGNRLMQHHLSPPSFASMPDLAAIEHEAVFFHPDKSGQLIDRLASLVK